MNKKTGEFPRSFVCRQISLDNQGSGSGSGLVIHTKPSADARAETSTPRLTLGAIVEASIVTEAVTPPAVEEDVPPENAAIVLLNVATSEVNVSIAEPAALMAAGRVVAPVYTVAVEEYALVAYVV